MLMRTFLNPECSLCRPVIPFTKLFYVYFNSLLNQIYQVTVGCLPETVLTDQANIVWVALMSIFDERCMRNDINIINGHV